MNSRYAWARQLAAFAILIAVWEAAGRAGMLNPLYLRARASTGPPSMTFADGRIWPRLEATFSAALGVLALGVAVGVFLGVIAAKVAVGFAFTGAVVGEFVAASQGLGYLLSFAQSTYNSALMLALVLLIMVVVLGIFALAGRVEKYLLRWN